MTLILGSLGYPLYIGSYLWVRNIYGDREIAHGCSFRALNIHRNAGAFVIASGGILGICAGLLWSAQVSVNVYEGCDVSNYWPLKKG